MPVEIRSEVVPRGADLPGLARFGARVLAALGRRAAAVSLLVVDDPRMRELNRRWRRIDRATDVLSFPAGPSPEDLLGDVVISLPRAREQAGRFGVPLTRELRRLLVHGILHLLGYDHKGAAERRRMRALEEELLALGARQRNRGRTGKKP